MTTRNLALRRLPKPSRRNQEVYYEVRVLGRTQAEAAAGRNISRRRVAQICRQVHAWRTGAGRGDDPEDQRRLALERLQEVLTVSLEMVDRSLTAVDRDTTGTDRQSLHRDAVQCLKVALQSARSLVKKSRRAGEQRRALVVPAVEVEERDRTGSERSTETFEAAFEALQNSLQAASLRQGRDDTAEASSMATGTCGR